MAKTQEATKGESTPSKATLQSFLQNFTREAIDEVVRIMRNSKQEGLRFAASKLIIDKSIADVKQVEVTGQNGEPIKLIINAGSGFVPSTVNFNATSASSYTGGQPTVQSADLAPESPENNHRNHRDNQAGPS